MGKVASPSWKQRATGQSSVGLMEATRQRGPAAGIRSIMVLHELTKSIK